MRVKQQILVVVIQILSKNSISKRLFSGHDDWYTPKTDINYPFTYALPAGIHFDGSIAYVARVYNSECFGYNVGAARVSTNPSQPGAFMACGNATHGAELFLNTTVELYANTLLKAWVKTNGTHARSVPSLLYHDGGIYYMAIGRYQINNYTVVGKVYINTTPDREGFHGWNPELNKYFQLAPSEEFEVLACV